VTIVPSARQIVPAPAPPRRGRTSTTLARTRSATAAAAPPTSPSTVVPAPTAPTASATSATIDQSPERVRSQAQAARPRSAQVPGRTHRNGGGGLRDLRPETSRPRGSLRALADGERQVAQLTPAHDPDGRRLSHPLRPQQRQQVVGAGHGLPVERDQDVA